MKISVLFFLPYPLHQAPSQRFRVEAFFPLLDKKGISYRTHEYLDEAAWRVLYKKGSLTQKGWAVVRGFLKRLFAILFIAPRYQYIFIHREAAPLGPPIFEWILVQLFRKKIIYDFDDAIWIPNVTESNRLAGYVKCFWKVRHVCQWSYKVSAGNAFLANWAGQYNERVVINPTCVDVEKRYDRVKANTQPFKILRQAKDDHFDKLSVTGTQSDNGKIVIGWTGSHSTLVYLDLIYPVLKRLEQELDFDFLVICNQAPSFSLRNLQFIPWQERTEIEDLLKIDIGVMPLVADAWSEGKCGFKIIQYLALGIPAVASPVGVNKDIVDEGVNGFLCRTEEEWYETLKKLLQDQCLRRKMGKAGREKIVREYSVQANEENFLSFFE